MWIIKQVFKVEPEPGQSDGSGSETLLTYCSPYWTVNTTRFFHTKKTIIEFNAKGKVPVLQYIVAATDKNILMPPVSI